LALRYLAPASDQVEEWVWVAVWGGEVAESLSGIEALGPVRPLLVVGTARCLTPSR
jgi:hypothetical protein